MYFSRIRIRTEIYKSTQLSKVLAESSYSVHRLLWDLFTNEKQRDFLYREEIAREQLGMKAGIHGEAIYYAVSEAKPNTENPFFQVDMKEYDPKLRKGDCLSFKLRANPVVTGKVDRENPEKYLEERGRRNVVDKNKLTKKRIRHDVVMNAQKEFLISLCEDLKLQTYLPINPNKSEYKDVLKKLGGDSLDKKLTDYFEEDLKYSEALHESMSIQNKLEWAIKLKVDNALEKWMQRKAKGNGYSILKEKNEQLKLQNSRYQWHSIKPKKNMKSGFSSIDFQGDLQVTDVDKFRVALFKGIGPAKAFGCGLMLVRRMKI